MDHRKRACKGGIGGLGSMNDHVPKSHSKSSCSVGLVLT